MSHIVLTLKAILSLVSRPSLGLLAMRQSHKFFTNDCRVEMETVYGHPSITICLIVKVKVIQILSQYSEAWKVRLNKCHFFAFIAAFCKNIPCEFRAVQSSIIENNYFLKKDMKCINCYLLSGDVGRRDTLCYYKGL